MNEFAINSTKNFINHQKEISELSIVDVVNIYDYINKLSQFVPENNEVLDDLEEIMEPLNKIIKELGSEERCVHCDGYLFKSDLPQYHYVCPVCDENF